MAVENYFVLECWKLLESVMHLLFIIKGLLFSCNYLYYFNSILSSHKNIGALLSFLKVYRHNRITL